MRTYKHWFVIEGKRRDEVIKKQWMNLKEFKTKYPHCSITVYNKEYGSMFDKVICLEVDQSYQELDLDYNSMFDGSLRRLEQKPPNIKQTRAFQDMFEIYAKEA